MSWTKEQKYNRAILLLAKNHAGDNWKTLDKVLALEHELNAEFAKDPSLVAQVKAGQVPKKIDKKLTEYVENYKKSVEVGRKLGEDLRRNGRYNTALKKVLEQVEAEADSGLPYNDKSDTEHQREIDRLQTQYDERPNMENYSKLTAYKFDKGEHPDIAIKRREVERQLRNKDSMARMKDMVLQEAVDKERAKRANAEAVKKMRDSSGDDLISDNRIRKRRVTSPNDSLSRFNQQIEAELNKEE